MAAMQKECDLSAYWIKIHYLEAEDKIHIEASRNLAG